MLAAQYLRIIINHAGKTIIIKWHSYHFYFSVGLGVMYVIGDMIIFTIGFLLNKANFFNRINKLYGAAVHYRGFGPVKINQHIIQLQSHKGCEYMFNSAYTGAVL